MRFLILALLISSCQTTPPVPPAPEARVCPGTIMVGWHNKTEVTAYDMEVYEKAKNIDCPRKFTKSPCLAKFYKVGDLRYKAMCGGYKDGK